MTKRKLEICCYSVESAMLAEQAGADRIELCDNYPEGGTTPSCGAIRHALEELSVPVNVMIRPRGGDFLYSTTEYEIMKKDVEAIRKMNAKGIVVGFLKANGDPDLERTKEIVELAGSMEVTFHRAFDMSRDPLSALEELKSTGINRILTSGARRTVMEGIDLLAALVERAGDDLSVMPGCGVNPHTLGELVTRTGAWEYHSAAQTFEDSRMEFVNPHVSMGGVDGVEEYRIASVDGNQIRAMVQILNNDS